MLFLDWDGFKPTASSSTQPTAWKSMPPPHVALSDRWQKTAGFLRWRPNGVPTRPLDFNLMVAADRESTSASRIRRSLESSWSFLMPNTSVKIAFTLLVVLATPAASFAQINHNTMPMDLFMQMQR
jgi:hypothetical protein